MSGSTQVGSLTELQMQIANKAILEIKIELDRYKSLQKWKEASRLKRGTNNKYERAIKYYEDIADYCNLPEPLMDLISELEEIYICFMVD